MASDSDARIDDVASTRPEAGGGDGGASEMSEEFQKSANKNTTTTSNTREPVPIAWLTKLKPSSSTGIDIRAGEATQQKKLRRISPPPPPSASIPPDAKGRNPLILGREILASDNDLQRLLESQSDSEPERLSESPSNADTSTASPSPGQATSKPGPSEQGPTTTPRPKFEFPYKPAYPRFDASKSARALSPDPVDYIPPASLRAAAAPRLPPILKLRKYPRKRDRFVPRPVLQFLRRNVKRPTQIIFKTRSKVKFDTANPFYKYSQSDPVVRTTAPLTPTPPEEKPDPFIVAPIPRRNRSSNLVALGSESSTEGKQAPKSTVRTYPQKYSSFFDESAPIVRYQDQLKVFNRPPLQKYSSCIDIPAPTVKGREPAQVLKKPLQTTRSQVDDSQQVVRPQDTVHESLTKKSSLFADTQPVEKDPVHGGPKKALQKHLPHLSDIPEHPKNQPTGIESESFGQVASPEQSERARDISHEEPQFKPVALGTPTDAGDLIEPGIAALVLGEREIRQPLAPGSVAAQSRDSKETSVAGNNQDSKTNQRGIPEAPFIENVEDFVTSKQEIEPAIRKFSEMIAKYTYMMESNARRAAGLKEKIPDIKKTLQMVQFLDNRNKKGDEDPISTMFELSDTLYAKASVTAPSEVYLWLGANVMLAYPNDEAIAMLKQKLSAAQESLRNCEEDIDFLRQQITTLEVNTSRMYNWNISLQRKEKEKAAAK
ncbi:hypothetical protein TWF696_000771 [Orbilia brochopaga]|uniref:Prefoldin subunit 3 n=1 Tax=Orbilia brochopaga TaxID=3140254 RepID=A0AAV9VCC0_9PEZI